MKIPCVQRIDWVVVGLSFLQPALTSIQFDNLTLVATALILGSRFKLSEISFMWLGKKSVSTLSYFFSDAKFSLSDMQELYVVRVLSLYHLADSGYFIIDDTMQHHTRFCKWIHGVCTLFDHVLHTNLKTVCIVFLYYSDGALIKFPITFRIFYKESGIPMPWQKGKQFCHKTKNELALDMLQWALDQGFPKAIVLADSWFCVEPFVKGLKRLQLFYVLEMKANNTIKVSSKEPKLTPKGRLAKRQYDLVESAKFFDSIPVSIRCGFQRNLDHGKDEKVLYHAKIATVHLNALPGKHRLVQSYDPTHKTIKLLITNQLHWNPIKILAAYSCRWVIEEFFRNAKQLSDMEGATIRSEQGVTLSLCLVSWIDFLLHHQNFERAAEKTAQESLSIPSILRQAQADNMEAFLSRVQQDETFVKKWMDIIQSNIRQSRKERKELVNLDEIEETALAEAA